MGFLLATLQLVLGIIITLIEYKKRSISMFFWAVLLILFGIPHWLGVASNSTTYEQSVLQEASLFAIGFQLIYLITRIIIMESIPRNYALEYSGDEDINLEKKETKTRFKIFFKLNILVGVIFIGYFLLRFGKLVGFSWEEVYLASINKETLFTKILEMVRSLNYLFYFAVTGLLIVSFLAKKKYATIIITGIILYYSMITKNRMSLLPLLVTIIIAYIYKNKMKVINQIIALGTIGIVSVYSVYGILVYRHAGSMENFTHKYDFVGFNKEIARRITNEEGELGLRNIFYHFISIDNDFPGLNEGATYKRLATVLIPTRFSFGLKPTDFAITMSSAYTGDIYNTNYSVHPTFFGDAYANFSMMGMLLGFLWAFIFYFLDKYIYKKNYIPKMLLTVLWGIVFIIVARGSVYNACFIGVVGTIIIKIIEMFVKKG